MLVIIQPVARDDIIRNNECFHSNKNKNLLVVKKIASSKQESVISRNLQHISSLISCVLAVIAKIFVIADAIIGSVNRRASIVHQIVPVIKIFSIGKLHICYAAVTPMSWSACSLHVKKKNEMPLCQTRIRNRRLLLSYDKKHHCTFI